MGIGNVNLSTVDYYFNEYNDFVLNTPVFVPIKIGSDTAIRSASFSYRFSENFALDFGFRSDILFLDDSDFRSAAMLNGYTRGRGADSAFTDWTITVLSSRRAEEYFYTNNLFTGGKYFFSNTSKN